MHGVTETIQQSISSGSERLRFPANFGLKTPISSLEQD